MKKLFVTVRLSALVALLGVFSAEGQQPGTPATAAPPPTAAPQTTPPRETTPAQQPLQRQNDTTNASTSLLVPWSVQFFYWFTSTSPSLRGGAAAADFEDLDYPGRGNYTPGVSLSIPVSKSALLNFSGFITKGSSNTTSNQALDLFGTSYATGTFLTSNYSIKNFKVSFQDLLYPYPRKVGQKWYLKTLWEVQYTTLTTNINAPFAPTTDSSGNPLTTTASGTRYVIYPTFGLGGEFHLTKNLEFQVNGSGFGIPHHSVIGDAEGSIGYRIGAVELLIAGKYYHFKTSTKNAEYFSVNEYGPYAALRLYPSEISIPCFFCKHKTVATTTATSPTSTANGPSTSSSPSNEAAVSTSQTTGTSSSTAHPGNYVRRFSAAATLSVAGLSLAPGGTNNVTNSATVSTMYQTTGAASRIGYGLTAQVAITDRFAVAIGGILRRYGYQFTTTVTTMTPSVVSGIVTTVTTSTINHEDTRANFIDVPAVVRFYSKSRHEPGARWFVEAGGAWRKVEGEHTSVDFTNASSILSCCTTTPTPPAHRNTYGAVAGAGVQVMDAFGIKVVPEVRYTRWWSQTFDAFTTHTQQNEVTAGLSITF